MDEIRLATRFGDISACRFEPPGAALGGLVVLQEIFGVNAHIRAVTEGLSRQGFVTIAPALFDFVAPDIELDYDGAGIKRGLALAREVGVDRAVAAVRAAADRLDEGGLAVAVAGFCWGGTLAFLANTRLGLPSASWYSGHSVNYLHERPRAPLIFHFGRRDAHIPPAVVEAHREALPAAEIHLYDAGHGFNCEPRADYDASAAALAMQRSLAFFRKVLPQKAS